MLGVHPEIGRTLGVSEATPVSLPAKSSVRLGAAKDNAK